MSQILSDRFEFLKKMVLEGKNGAEALAAYKKEFGKQANWSYFTSIRRAYEAGRLDECKSMTDAMHKFSVPSGSKQKRKASRPDTLRRKHVAAHAVHEERESEAPTLQFSAETRKKLGAGFSDRLSELVGLMQGAGQVLSLSIDISSGTPDIKARLAVEHSITFDA